MSVSFISMFLFLVTMLSEIYLYCYYGTTLFEEVSYTTKRNFADHLYIIYVLE
jgi:hypothetical protein